MHTEFCKTESGHLDGDGKITLRRLLEQHVMRKGGGENWLKIVSSWWALVFCGVDPSEPPTGLDSKIERFAFHCYHRHIQMITRIAFLRIVAYNENGKHSTIAILMFNWRQNCLMLSL
jgi:hypothetical protein